MLSPMGKKKSPFQAVLLEQDHPVFWVPNPFSSSEGSVTHTTLAPQCLHPFLLIIPLSPRYIWSFNDNVIILQWIKIRFSEL